MPQTEYQSRFAKGKLRLRLHNFNNSLKKWLLILVVKSEWFVNKYQIYDHFTLQHNEEDWLSQKESRIPYTDINLEQIHFYDVIEIDSINRKSLERFRNLVAKTKMEGISNNSDAVKKYRSFKDKMDIISTGSLLTLSFRNNRNKFNDYLQYVAITYIKTTESYVMIRVKVTASELFLSKFKEIISAKVVSRGIVHFKSYWHILTRIKFIDHESFGTTSLSRGLDNLFYDMQYQVHHNILKYIGGSFSRSIHLQKIPSMYYFEIDNLENFYRDKQLQVLFPRNFEGPFFSSDGKVQIFLNEFEKQNRNSLRIVKEIQIDETQKDSHKSKQNIHMHFLLDSFAFPCAFSAKLNFQLEELNRLKREIYDFSEHISDKQSMYIFYFFTINRKYVRLKIRLTRFITSMKRFEAEFTSTDMIRYVDEGYLKAFYATSPIKERETLHSLYLSEFKYLTKKYDSNIKGIHEVFKSVEELNAYRTNLVLQISSVVIAIFAFIFAFEKIKHFLRL